MLSDRRNFRLLLEVGIAESNGVIGIVAKHSKIAVSMRMCKENEPTRLKMVPDR